MNQELVEFYRGVGRGPRERTIEDIWSFGHDQLESVHDYIQWLFPTASPSRYHPTAPLLDEETMALFRGDVDLRSRLLRSLEVMLSFFGLELQIRDEYAPGIGKAPDYRQRQSQWQGEMNHNLLRLTRILEALRLLGLETYSVALYYCLQTIRNEVPRKIAASTLDYWRRAAGIPGKAAGTSLWERLQVYLRLR